VDKAARAGRRFASYTRVQFDHDSMRDMADIDENELLQPEGVILLQNGHLLVTHEKKPAGLFELGPPVGGSLGIGPAAYLPHGERFSTPGQLVARAWWPLPGSLREDVDDLSDLAAFDDHLYLLSDKSRRIGCMSSRAGGGGTPDRPSWWRRDLPNGWVNGVVVPGSLWRMLPAPNPE
jgi:hypothetical protein